MSEPVDLGATGGAVWATPSEWVRRCGAEGCVICVAGAPLDVIAELRTSWVTAPPTAPLPGYVCVVARQHVIEPFELAVDDQMGFWGDAMVVARAVAGLLQPVKMNYEIHGNTLPHLHLHLFPRQVDDPFVGGPIDPRWSSVRRTDADIRSLQKAIEAAIS